MLNIFRMVGDVSHLASIIILIHQITVTRSISGISFSTQSMYALVFATRYIDLFFRWVSLYNFLMKVFFIGSSVYILHLMKNKYRSSDNAKLDTFPWQYLIGGSAVAALITTYSYSITEILWAFSLWLESVAILPQLDILQRTGEAQGITTHYIFALGLYRAMYIPNWLYRYFTEGRVDWLSVVTGVIQTALYSDFFYIYYTRVMRGLKFELPV